MVENRGVRKKRGSRLVTWSRRTSIAAAESRVSRRVPGRPEGIVAINVRYQKAEIPRAKCMRGHVCARRTRDFRIITFTRCARQLRAENYCFELRALTNRQTVGRVTKIITHRALNSRLGSQHQQQQILNLQSTHPVPDERHSRGKCNYFGKD